MKNIRIRHEWGVPRKPKHGTQFTTEQMHHLKALQQLLQTQQLNVSLSVLIRAGVLSLSERIQSELDRDTESGVAVVTRMLEKAAEKDTVH